MPKGNAMRERLLLVACAVLATLLVTWVTRAQAQAPDAEVIENLRVRNFTLVDDNGADVATFSATGKTVTILPAWIDLPAWKAAGGGSIKLNTASSSIILEHPDTPDDQPIRRGAQRTVVNANGVAVMVLKDDKPWRSGFLSNDVLRIGASGQSVRYGPTVLELRADGNEGKITIEDQDGKQSIALVGPTRHHMGENEFKTLAPRIIMFWDDERLFTTWGEDGPQISVDNINIGNAEGKVLGALKIKNQKD